VVWSPAPGEVFDPPPADLQPRLSAVQAYALRQERPAGLLKSDAPEVLFALYTSSSGAQQPDGSIKPDYVRHPVWIINYRHALVLGEGPVPSPVPSGYSQEWRATVTEVIDDTTGRSIFASAMSESPPPFVTSAPCTTPVAISTGSPATSPSPASVSSPSPSSVSSPQSVVNVYIISMIGTTGIYSPDPVRIKIGQSIRWTNQDVGTHTATADATPGFDSSFLMQGQSYTSSPFAVAGMINYHCDVHPGHHGTIIVSP
jgi:plastocyanin